MKKNLLTAMFAALSCISFGQVPNNSFEIWADWGGAFEQPYQWQSSNFLNSLVDQFSGGTMNHPPTVVKDASKVLGLYSVKIQNVEGTESGEVVDTVPGFLSLGDAISLGGPDRSGIPYAQRPGTLRGYYKFTQGAPMGSLLIDTALIGWAMTKWNPTTMSREIIGRGLLDVYEPQSTFTQFNIDIVYTDEQMPDTLTIAMFSSTTKKKFPGTALYIDNLSVLAITGIHTSFSSIAPVHVFPNPAATDINLEELPKGAASVEVKDLNGRAMKEVSVNGTEVKFSVTDLPSGLYYYGVKNENGDVLYTGKFDVKN